MSTSEPADSKPSSRFGPGFLLLCAYAALCGYLGRDVQQNGDGASYVLQAVEGQPFERSLHVGYLLTLRVWVHGCSWLGLSPSAAANLLAAVTTALALLLVLNLANQLLDELPVPLSPGLRRFLPLAAPLSLLCAEVSWQAALFAEVYGPLATLLLGHCLALKQRRDRLAATLLLAAVLVHPAAWALWPGLLLASGRTVKTASLKVPAMAMLPWLLCLALLAPEWWSGGRGLLAMPEFGRSPWQSLQVAWRMLSRDLALGATPIVLGAIWLMSHRGHPAARRWLLGVLMVCIGAALVLDRYPDNNGQLPALWMACCLAPWAAAWLAAASQKSAQQLAVLAWGAVLLLTIADATSAHDAVARKADRQDQQRRLTCAAQAQTERPWREVQLQRLACREQVTIEID